MGSPSTVSLAVAPCMVQPFAVPMKLYPLEVSTPVQSPPVPMKLPARIVFSSEVRPLRLAAMPAPAGAVLPTMVELYRRNLPDCPVCGCRSLVIAGNIYCEHACRLKWGTSGSLECEGYLWLDVGADCPDWETIVDYMRREER